MEKNTDEKNKNNDNIIKEDNNILNSISQDYEKNKIENKDIDSKNGNINLQKEVIEKNIDEKKIEKENKNFLDEKNININFESKIDFFNDLKIKDKEISKGNAEEKEKNHLIIIHNEKIENNLENKNTNDKKEKDEIKNHEKKMIKIIMRSI